LSGVQEIETRRLRLEPWSPRHLKKLERLARTPEVMRYIGPGLLWSPEQTHRVFDRQLAHWEEHGFGWRSAIDKASESWIGFIGLNYVPEEAQEIEGREVEIGWWLDPRVWGKGLATEGGVALRDEAFERVKLERIIGRFRPANVASERIMQKLGMIFERDGTDRYGEIVRIYSLDCAGWSAARTTASAIR
jgi:RimJ/RimL family protein N-acetyltransferase